MCFVVISSDDAISKTSHIKMKSAGAWQQPTSSSSDFRMLEIIFRSEIVDYGSAKLPYWLFLNEIWELFRS